MPVLRVRLKEEHLWERRIRITAIADIEKGFNVIHPDVEIVWAKSRVGNVADRHRDRVKLMQPQRKVARLTEYQVDLISRFSRPELKRKTL